MSTRERFAPSPTGPLHLGHAYSALMGFDAAQAAGGQFFLRIEDIDQTRARKKWEDQIFDDLSWLGIAWQPEVLRQSQRMDAYKTAIAKLDDLGLLYSCSCNRKDIENATTAPQEGGATHGPDGLIYPGTCRARCGIRPDHAVRLDVAAAVEKLDVRFLTYHEIGQGNDNLVTIDAQKLAEWIGDIVIARRDMGTSYHLSVVVDDAAQNITHVTRGEDLIDATAVHVLLQTLLGVGTPIYRHHKLIRDENGKRLAKRDDARAIATYRKEGRTPQDIRKLVGL